MIKVDGATISRVILNGKDIHQVWVDGVMVFPSRKLEVHEFTEATGKKYLDVPEWATAIAIVAIGGGGGGAGGAQVARGSHLSAGEPGTVGYKIITDPDVMREAKTVDVTVGAGGDGGGTTGYNRAPSKGTSGYPTRVNVFDSDYFQTERLQQLGGEGGSGTGNRSEKPLVYDTFAETIPGIVDKGTCLQLPSGTGVGGAGGLSGVYPEPGRSGGVGWVKIAFYAGY
ncbi:hypothetical protein [Corynebacterium antarcticum]|uniref:glycine-rich domain-containing protein n=1 Tax=Corynebacterium antarcticum TaxID=2800405 RepID=UPI0020064876|nr:hypothetical protein [Corynebacterium antarcticum]MCK7661961.1 hypothetical protein [Corynebacterium antarcticum]